MHQLRLEKPGFDKKHLLEIADLKHKGIKVKNTLDNVEVKTRTYNREIINNQFSRTKMPDAIYDSNRNYETEEVRQSHIVYCMQIKGRSYKFISQPTTKEAFEMRSFIDENKVIDLF